MMAMMKVSTSVRGEGWLWRYATWRDRMRKLAGAAGMRIGFFFEVNIDKCR